MSYQVLARKWRPRSFREMVGQTHVLKALINALDSQRLHHAYLFTGTRGVGKTTVSRILAKSLNCQGADGQGGRHDDLAEDIRQDVAHHHRRAFCPDRAGRFDKFLFFEP